MPFTHSSIKRKKEIRSNKRSILQDIGLEWCIESRDNNSQENYAGININYEWITKPEGWSYQEDKEIKEKKLGRFF